MTTFKRICVKAWETTDSNGGRFKVERGREYITSAVEDGHIVVFSTFWVPVPASIFAGEERFT